jgi:hypothetical protein
MSEIETHTRSTRIEDIEESLDNILPADSEAPPIILNEQPVPSANDMNQANYEPFESNLFSPAIEEVERISRTRQTIDNRDYLTYTSGPHKLELVIFDIYNSRYICVNSHLLLFSDFVKIRSAETWSGGSDKMNLIHDVTSLSITYDNSQLVLRNCSINLFISAISEVTQIYEAAVPLPEPDAKPVGLLTRLYQYLF